MPGREWRTPSEDHRRSKSHGSKTRMPFASAPSILAAWKMLCRWTWSSILPNWRKALADRPCRTGRQKTVSVFILNTRRLSTPAPKPSDVFKMNTPRNLGPTRSCRRTGCCSALPCWAGASASLPASSVAIRPTSGDGSTPLPSRKMWRRGWRTWWLSTWPIHPREGSARPQLAPGNQPCPSREARAGCVRAMRTARSC